MSEHFSPHLLRASSSPIHGTGLSIRTRLPVPAKICSFFSTISTTSPASRPPLELGESYERRIAHLGSSYLGACAQGALGLSLAVAGWCKSPVHMRQRIVDCLRPVYNGSTALFGAVIVQQSAEVHTSLTPEPPSSPVCISAFLCQAVPGGCCDMRGWFSSFIESASSSLLLPDD